MRDLTKQERIAIEAVARRFSATWEKGSDPLDAYMMAAGKRVAVDITTLKRSGAGQGKAAKPRLRFDKGSIVGSQNTGARGRAIQSPAKRPGAHLRGSQRLQVPGNSEPR